MPQGVRVRVSPPVPCWSRPGSSCEWQTNHRHESSVTVHHGDNLDVLPTLDADSIDAIVTDPPYGLSFMGKGWD